MRIVLQNNVLYHCQSIMLKIGGGGRRKNGQLKNDSVYFLNKMSDNFKDKLLKIFIMIKKL